MKAITKISAILLTLGMLAVSGQAFSGPTEEWGDSLFDRIYSE